MGRLKRLRSTVVDIAISEIPGADLIPDWKKNGYKRKRAKSAPKGWITADAVVEEVSGEETGRRIGEHEDDYGDRCFDATITYVVQGEGGAPLKLTVGPNELVSEDLPEKGSTWKIAYDPSQTDAVVLLGE